MKDFYIDIRLFGINIKIHILSVLTCLFFIFSENSSFPVIVFAGALIHELGHFAAMKTLGVKVISFTILPVGADIKCDSENLSYKKEIFIFLSGPLANLVFSVVFFLVFYAAGKENAKILFFALSNFFLFIFNIIPIKVFDGGRILENILLCVKDIYTAERISTTVNIISYIILCLFSVLSVIFSQYNVSLIFINIYLFFSAFSRI